MPAFRRIRSTPSRRTTPQRSSTASAWPSAASHCWRCSACSSPEPARPVDPGRVGRRRTRPGGGTRRLTRRPPGAYTRGDGSARHRAPRVPGRAGSGRRGPRATGDPLGRRRPDTRFGGSRIPRRPCRPLATRPAAPGAARGPGPHRMDQPARAELRLQAADDPAGRGLRRGHVLRVFATKPRPPIVAHLCDDIACRFASAETVISDVERASVRRAARRRWRADLVPVALPRSV